MLYFWGYGIVIGYVLYPSWLFQGLEMMRESAIIHLASRLLCLPLMLFLIKTPANSLDAMIFISMPSLLAGVFAMYYLIKKNLIIWRWICLEDIKTVCTKSFSFFISKSSISLYNFIVPLSLGIISGPEALAIFSIADKVKTFAVSITSPIGQALFPRMAFYGKSQKSKIVLLALKVIKWQSIILIPIGTTIWIYSLEIVTLIAGEAFTAASMPLKWLAFVPWLSATSSILGLQVMLSINRNNLFSLINLNSLILSVIGIFIFNNSLNENLVSMLILAIESITFLLSLIYIFNIFKLEILKNNK
jgi:O-antigen/teichoic acid export membrane protein